MKKAFIHHNGALGDLLLSFPSMTSIRKEFGFIHIAGRFDAVNLLMDYGLADEASSSDNSLYASFYSEYPQDDAISFLKRFDIAFVFANKEMPSFISNIKKAISDLRTILTIPPDERSIHSSLFRLRQLSSSNPDNSTVYTVEIPEKFRRLAENFLMERGYDSKLKLAGIHPGSGSNRKNWPSGNYMKLIERLIKQNSVFCIVFSGPAEDHKTKAQFDLFASKNRGVIHAADIELPIAGALLSLCGIYAGNDSGVTHLAALTGSNVIALFGPTNPEIWRPIGKSVEVIRTRSEDGSVGGISVEEVFQTLNAHLQTR